MTMIKNTDFIMLKKKKQITGGPQIVNRMQVRGKTIFMELRKSLEKRILMPFRLI